MTDRSPFSARVDRFLESSPRVAFAYLLLTLAMTWPLALNWRSALPAGAGDLWQNYWNFWWWKKCLLEGLNPYRSDYLFHPFGIDLVFHTHSVFNQIAAMPANLLFGEAAAYNFSVFLALALSGFGCRLLVRELTGDSRAGFLAGLVFAFFPQHIEQTLEHVNLFSTQFLPLTLFYAVRWTRTRRMVDAAALGLCFGLNALCSWHLGLKLAFVLAPWALWVLWRSRRSPAGAARGLAAAAGSLVGQSLHQTSKWKRASDLHLCEIGKKAESRDPTYSLLSLHPCWSMQSHKFQNKCWRSSCPLTKERKR